MRSDGAFQVIVPVLGVAGLLCGVIGAGERMRAELRVQDRFTLAFADIECIPPPDQQRADFLSEVQYLAGMPQQLRLLEETLPQRLADAFARHPWVEKVERVEQPGRRVKVHLVYRTPVLAVPHEGQLRAVDRHGILLPSAAVNEDLPLFCGEARMPNGPAGTRWGDSTVEAAARSMGGPP